MKDPVHQIITVLIVSISLMALMLLRMLATLSPATILSCQEACGSVGMDRVAVDECRCAALHEDSE